LEIGWCSGEGGSTHNIYCLLPIPKRSGQNVKANLDSFKPGGGYVFNNVHNIQADVPPANVIAMYEAAYVHGSY
jgi:uroporphyrinogen-III decarboxylase